ncbi:TOMM precursor leader peptide-binding protein [Murinocardiopsis flavida]|nr:TOMM precursor leader peptide-binding protein [Murinocardiopsis flavida]
MRSQTGGAESPSDSGFTGFRPRLRHDALFADNGDGALLHHPEGRFLIKGAGAYGLVRAIAPYLDGSATVGELCAELPEAQRASVMRVLASLADRGFVRDSRPGPDTALPDAVRRRFADQIGYIEHYADGGAARFARFRSARVLVAGSGEVDRAVALGLLRNGIAAVHVADTGPSGTAWAAADAEAAELRSAGCPAEVRRVDLTAPDALAGVLSGGPPRPAAPTAPPSDHGVDGVPPVPPTGHEAEGAPAPPTADWDFVVLSPGEGRTAALWRHLAGRRADDGPVAIPMAVIGGQAVVGPMTGPGRRPCWCCAVLRIGAGADLGAGAALWRELALPSVPAAAAPLDPNVAAMLGTMVAFDVFRERTGALAAETDGAVVCQDLGTLESTREPLLPHPLCPSCGTPAGGVPAPPVTGAPVATAPPVGAAADRVADGARPAAEPPQDPALMPPDTAVASPDPAAEPQVAAADHGALFGPRLGVFTGYADAAMAQSPLKAGAVRMPLPVRTGRQRVITAFDVSTVAAARGRAVGAAALCYADEVVRTRDAVAARSPAPPVDVVRVAPDRLATWSGLPVDAADAAEQHWLPSTSMVDGGVRWLPAAAVLPFSDCNDAALFERSAAGAGSGPDPAQAAAEGLLSAFGYEALRAALHRTARVAEIPAAALGAADETVFLLRTAENLGCAPLLLDLAGGAPAHVVLAVDLAGDGPPLWTSGAGLDRRAAATGALRDLLGIRQLGGVSAATAHEDAADAAEGVDLGGPLLPGLDPRALLADADGPAPERPATDHAALIADLRARGGDAFAADVTPVDLGACGLRTVRVVRTR